MTSDATTTTPDAADLIKLDKSKTYGTVFPPENNAHFFQDGFYFTASGDLVREMLDEAATKKLARRTARVAADRRKEELYRQELAAQGLDETEVAEAIAEAKAEDAPIEADPKAIDLVAWARGQKKYVFGQVRKAFKDQYAIDVPDKKTGIEVLVDEGKVGEDEVAV